MNTVIIVQARMTSSRLPGKILKKVLDKSLLEFQIERLKRVKLANNLVIATTSNATDDPVVSLCDSLGVDSFRGSEDDVLSRYYKASVQYQADHIVRVTADCPLIDPFVIDKVIEYYQNHHPNFDYVSNIMKRTYPRGMDTEIFSFDVLKTMQKKSIDKVEREHVTYYIYTHLKDFKVGDVKNEFENSSHHRWTVDTPDDFELIRLILERLYPLNSHFTLSDILKLLNQNQAWFKINAHIEQKKEILDSE